MRQLRDRAKNTFGEDYSEKKACKGMRYSFDFYFHDECTVVEVALGLHNPISEYERDIFKCLLAREQGAAIDQLFLICKPGGADRQNAPGPRAIASFVARNFQMEVVIIELLSGISASELLDRIKAEKLSAKGGC